jgi:hypothetical protein
MFAFLFARKMMQSLCRSFLDRHGEISLFNESFCFMSISVYLCLSLSISVCRHHCTAVS